MMNEAYKQHAQIRLVGQVGTSLWDVTATCSFMFYATVLKKFVRHSIIEDWMWYCGIGMIAVQLPGWGNGLLLAAAIVISMNNRSLDTSLEKKSTLEHIESFTPFRALLMLLTVYCILAVDFELFPSRHMKTESTGHSLMDVGVGAFIVSHGVSLSYKIVCCPYSAIRKWLKTSFPLAVCGLIRILLIKGTNYHEHVTEYGVHWNFFFTLSLMPVLFSPMVPLLLTLRGYGCVPVVIAILCLHQYCCTIYEDYLSSDNRQSLFDMNKEGVVSLPGYLVLFCGGILFGNTLRNSGYQKLFLLSFFCLITSVVCDSLIQPCSRKFCNAAYVTSVLFISSFVLSLLAAFPNEDVGCGEFISSLSKYGLQIFLVSNLLTGCVNISIQTLSCSTMVSVVILSLYLFVSTTVSVKLLKGLTKKFTS